MTFPGNRRVVEWLVRPRAGGGMGDVKLLAALGAWPGAKWVLIAIAVRALVAALAAVAVSLYATAREGVSGTGKRHLRARRSGSKSGGKRLTRVLLFTVPGAISTYAVLPRP